MKIKVRGLVFVGFAAAVFASSAMADNETEKKTVTSKYYVDQTFQTLDNITTTTEAATAAAWDSDTTYPSMAVLKSVRDALDAVDVVDDGGYVDVNENQPGIFTVGLDSDKIDAMGVDIQASTTTNDGKLVTAGAVKAFAQDKRKIDAANGDGSAGSPYTTTIASSSANDTYPTSQNVYQFVTGAIGTAGESYQRKLTSTETGLYVGTYSSNNTNTWKALEAENASAQAAKEYVTIKADNGGVYQINLLDSVIGYNGVEDTANSVPSDITSNSDKLATGKAVYEYVGQYAQPIATATAVQTGYNGTWHTLGGDSYITVADSGTAASVTLGNFAAASDLYAVTDANDGKLVTAGLVRTMRDTTLTATGENDQTIPTSKAVVDYVTASVDTQFDLANNPCREAGTAGSYCALVAYYDTNSNGVKYEWTIMAPVPSNL